MHLTNTFGIILMRKLIMPKFYRRETYIARINKFRDECELIKVLTGVRRCGKSTILHILEDDLKREGINENNILYIDLNKRPYKSIKTTDELEKIIDDKFKNIDGIKYLFIDEVQNVTKFEESIESYRLEGDYSIFITGSNSYLLSGELITKLTGRYIEFNINTLSFGEYLDIKRFFKKEVSPNLDDEFIKYILEGGFPLAAKYDDPSQKKDYILSIIDEIYKKDIKKNNKIRDKSLFNQVMTYIINNFGATTSVNNLCDYLEKINKHRPSKHTIYSYLNILVNAKILCRCSRFDLKSKKSLNGYEKYYLTDLSFYYATNADLRINYGPVLENVCYNYFKENNYTISIGKIGLLEIDFILSKPFNQGYAYVQVCKTLDNGIYDDNGISEVEYREFSPLEKIKDNYKKIVLTLDKLEKNKNGILSKNIISILLESNNTF